jgi:hypothetical protein
VRRYLGSFALDPHMREPGAYSIRLHVRLGDRSVIRTVVGVAEFFRQTIEVRALQRNGSAELDAGLRSHRRVVALELTKPPQRFLDRFRSAPRK